MLRLEAATEDDDAPEPALHMALAIAEVLRGVPFEVNLWQAQNIWNDLLEHSRDNRSTYRTEDWNAGFRKLGLALNIAVDRLVVEEAVSTA